MGDWRKSSFSSANGGACVEVALVERIMIRDATDRDGVTLGVPAGAWQSFTASLK